jgi:hypothetical protein
MTNAMQRAITRAKNEDLHVRMVTFGEYVVTNRSRNTQYVVKLWRDANGAKKGRCNCKAGSGGGDLQTHPRRYPSPHSPRLTEGVTARTGGLLR